MLEDIRTTDMISNWNESEHKASSSFRKQAEVSIDTVIVEMVVFFSYMCLICL